MQKKFQVFVSSTYVDMRAERQAAVEAILMAGHIPAGMELFSAGDETQLDVIHQWIGDSDIFMLILGGRYGSIEPKSGKSYIQLEYEFAVKKKKKLFALVFPEKSLEEKAHKQGLSVVERDNPKLLAEFRKTVTGKMCSFFDDMKDLKLEIFRSLKSFENDETLLGWVRGDEALDPKKTVEELERLRADNQRLIEENKVLEARATAVAINSSLSRMDTLSADAKQLLQLAAGAAGTIITAKSGGRMIVQVAGRNLIDPHSPRLEAQWRSAIQELKSKEYIESVGPNTYQVAHAGYQAIDRKAADGEPPVNA